MKEKQKAKELVEEILNGRLPCTDLENELIQFANHQQKRIEKLKEMIKNYEEGTIHGRDWSKLDI